MTLNTMLYSYAYEEAISVNDFRDDDDPLKEIEEKPVEEQTAMNEETESTYIRSQIFDEILERKYTIECEGYVDKNDNDLINEKSIEHLTNGEHKWVLVIWIMKIIIV